MPWGNNDRIGIDFPRLNFPIQNAEINASIRNMREVKNVEKLVFEQIGIEERELFPKKFARIETLLFLHPVGVKKDMPGDDCAIHYK